MNFFFRANKAFVSLRTIAALFAFACPARAAEPPVPDHVEFNRDVRPFLSDTYFKCHGFDAAKRKAGLRLDTPEGAVENLDGHVAIVQGHPEHSEGYLRLTSHDPKELMPPPDSGLKLTPRQVAIFRKWIEQGATYDKHWSLIPPGHPTPPAVKGGKWGRNPIDAFAFDRLAREGLAPSPEAAKETLIRRATFDLTGLPPTPREVDAFLADSSANAYEKLVDRLLASPRYGERMAAVWLDAARYADTSGYQADWERFMWPWRDWVVRAFNDNKPFDQFTIEQLAGDLLPNPTIDQKLATAFNRNHRINDEAGIVPEEYLVEYAIDRVETTSTVWLGMTIGCARCHDHKYDPVTQREFYELFAFFDNVPEKGQDGRPGYAAPFMRVPPADAREKAAALHHAIDEAEKQIAVDTPDALARLDGWDREMRARAAGGRGVDPWSPAKVAKVTATGGVKFKRDEDGAFVASGPNPDTTVYEATLDATLPAVSAIRLDTLLEETSIKGPGRGNGNFILTEFEVDVKPPGAGAKAEPVKVKSAYADYYQNKYSIDLAIDGKKETGWAVDGDSWREEHSAAFVFDKPVPTPGGTTLTVRLRQESKLKGFTIGKFALSVSGDAHPPLDNPSPEVAAALKLDPAARSATQQGQIAGYFRSFDPGRDALRKKAADARRSLEEVGKLGTPVMVMQELPTRRDTYLLKRGQYDQPDKSEKLLPGVPAALMPAGAKRPTNRLELAKWLVSPENPLTARVAVNRLWQMNFGVGLVKTSEDFGLQGESPSHPELLDWLATEFVRSGWAVKAMQKLIVTSATYRQSSRVTADLEERDPENRLLARGPRFRLSAYQLRDNALAVGGLLSGTIGGPPVKPYQPAGLWEELSFGNKTSVDRYVQDHGDSLYRRGLYVFWKRSVPPPALMAFDAAGREACSVRQGRTNTPLQALTLLNDVTFVEAARATAQRMMTEGGSTPPQRIAYGWRLAMARQPSERELGALVKSFGTYLAKYQADGAAARALLSVGESKRDESLDPAEHAAYTAVANVLLNLDETVTKE